jgi:hypothetical protein
MLEKHNFKHNFFHTCKKQIYNWDVSNMKKSCLGIDGL